MGCGGGVRTCIPFTLEADPMLPIRFSLLFIFPRDLLQQFALIYVAWVSIALKLQVYHYCHADGRQDTFLCPPQTAFNQKVFVCDWWYNVDCGSALEYYQLNEDLYRVRVSLSSSQPNKTMLKFLRRGA